MEFKNPVVENKSLMEEIGEYVKSDVYMYAPMAVAPPPPVKGTWLYGSIFICYLLFMLTSCDITF